jgi:pseudouridine synthase
VGRSFRLNQAIAKTGYCSRRRADELISAGSVQVNGVVARNYNMPVDPKQDKLCVSGEELKIKSYTYIAMNKPLGIVTSCSDEKSRRSILDLLPAKLRFLRPVGRLDMNSTGLLLLTNDGELTQRLTHPSLHELKCYEVLVDGRVTPQVQDKLRRGVHLPDGKTLPAQVCLMKTTPEQSLLKVGLREGRNRQIRRMFQHLGYRVRQLTRISIGALELGKLQPGAWRYLDDHELRKLGVKI